MDFKNTILIMTSNIGSEYLLNGIREDGGISDEAEAAVTADLRARFRPEFLNRLDEIIMFRPLTKENIAGIVSLMIADVNRRLSDRGITLALTDRAVEKVVSDGYDPVYGARPLRRYIQKHVETEAARIILTGDVGRGSVIEIDADGGRLTGRVR